jgi:hypothetical protein
MLLVIVCGRLLEAAALSCFLSTFVDLAQASRSQLFADPNTAALAISRCAGGAGASGAVGAAPGRGFDSLSSMVSWRCCSPRLGGCDVLGDGGCMLFTSLASCSGRALLARLCGLGLAWRGFRIALASDPLFASGPLAACFGRSAAGSVGGSPPSSRIWCWSFPSSSSFAFIYFSLEISVSISTGSMNKIDEVRRGPSQLREGHPLVVRSTGHGGGVQTRGTHKHGSSHKLLKNDTGFARLKMSVVCRSKNVKQV